MPSYSISSVSPDNQRKMPSISFCGEFFSFSFPFPFEIGFSFSIGSLPGIWYQKTGSKGAMMTWCRYGIWGSKHLLIQHWITAFLKSKTRPNSQLLLIGKWIKEGKRKARPWSTVHTTWLLGRNERSSSRTFSSITKRVFHEGCVLSILGRKREVVPDRWCIVFPFVPWSPLSFLNRQSMLNNKGIMFCLGKPYFSWTRIWGTREPYIKLCNGRRRRKRRSRNLTSEALHKPSANIENRDRERERGHRADNQFAMYMVFTSRSPQVIGILVLSLLSLSILYVGWHSCKSIAV